MAADELQEADNIRHQRQTIDGQTTAVQKEGRMERQTMTAGQTNSDRHVNR